MKPFGHKTCFITILVIFIGIIHRAASADDTAFADDCPPSTSYQCKDGKCISREYVCNGIRDCKDSEDERQCGELLIII
jgi:hypothetical protein